MREKKVKRVMLTRQHMHLLMSQDYCLSSIASSLPLNVEELLKKYGDVFPKDTPHGLSHLRGIEHQIDLMSRVSIPNRPTYRSNPEDFDPSYIDKNHIVKNNIKKGVGRGKN